MAALPWAEILRNAASIGWTHADVLDRMTWAELNYVWFGGSGVRVSAAQGNGTLKDQINRRRAAQGKPPMKPQPSSKRR